MNEICDILEQDIYFVNKTSSRNINTVNGLVDDNKIVNSKKNFLKSAMSYLTDDLVKKKLKSYPTDNKVKIEFSTDFVVIEKDKMLDLIKHIENLEHKLCKCN